MSLSIGIACYPSVGGSGVIATEVGLAMARRGHQVHFISTSRPFRLRDNIKNVHFHPIQARDYPVFPQVPAALAQCSAIVNVAKTHGLHVLHAHYAVPHATSAWMAREVLNGELAVLTTLHGTDITLIGSDPSYLPVTRHSIQQSDAVTAPSAFLRDETYRRFEISPNTTPIHVIPNFVDTVRFCPSTRSDRPQLEAIFGPTDVPVIVHVSNFRPLKRVDRVVEVFASLVRERPCKLLLVGSGPVRPAVEAQIETLGIRDDVQLLPELEDIPSLLRECTVFLLPSETESFGLAALEALSSGVPVVAFEVGGLPEVVQHGTTGFLAPADDVERMTQHVAALIDTPLLREEMATAARLDVCERFQTTPMIDRYEALYHKVSGRK